MDLSVSYNHKSTKDEAYEEACRQITPEYVKKFGVQADISFDKENGKISATGKGFTLTLAFAESECQVDLQLNFMLKAFKGKILEGIEQKLKRHI